MLEPQLPKIVSALESKAVMKQSIYRSTQAVFAHLKEVAQEVARSLAAHFEKVDPNVVVSYTEKNEFEFHLKFSGDVLTFTMHTNITTLLEEHIILKSPYVAQDHSRGFFGSILVYNFMADSIKYNRLGDLGYLVARLLVNKDGHFYIEGVRQLNFLFPDIAQNQISTEVLIAFIEHSMLAAIDQDLVSPNFQDIMVVSLEAKQANSVVNSGAKVGFQSKATKDNMPWD
jgi:hypothetical protein